MSILHPAPSLGHFNPLAHPEGCPCNLCEDDRAESAGIELEIRAALLPADPAPADDDSVPCPTCLCDGTNPANPDEDCPECGGVGEVYEPDWREALAAGPSFGTIESHLALSVAAAASGPDALDRLADLARAIELYGPDGALARLAPDPWTAETRAQQDALAALDRVAYDTVDLAWLASRQDDAQGVTATEEARERDRRAKLLAAHDTGYGLGYGGAGYPDVRGLDEEMAGEMQEGWERGEYDRMRADADREVDELFAERREMEAGL